MSLPPRGLPSLRFLVRDTCVCFRSVAPAPVWPLFTLMQGMVDPFSWERRLRLCRVDETREPFTAERRSTCAR
jgi:hypothetical protein